MAKSRYINTEFWTDPYSSNLDPTEKLVFLYLLTNPETNMAGIYQLPLRRMAFDTGYDQDMLKKILMRFERDGKIFVEQDWVILKNFGKHQTYNPSTAMAASTKVSSLPEWLLQRLIDHDDRIWVDFLAILKPFPQALDRLSQAVDKLPTNSNSNFNRTKLNIVNSNELTRAEPDEFGDAEINRIVEHFEKKIGKMPRPIYQRRAAKTLIQRHTFEKTIGAINAVAASRGEQFAPNITSLTQLRDKWLDLENFYARKQKKQSKLKVV